MMNKINEADVGKAYDELKTVFAIKNQNYGNSVEKSIDKYGLISALTRISDKFNRAETLILNKSDGTADESLIDTLTDLANYCVMTAVYIKNVKHEKFLKTLKTLRGENDGKNNEG